jgi:hypothetical protein
MCTDGVMMIHGGLICLQSKEISFIFLPICIFILISQHHSLQALLLKIQLLKSQINQTFKLTQPISFSWELISLQEHKRNPINTNLHLNSLVWKVKIKSRSSEIKVLDAQIAKFHFMELKNSHGLELIQSHKTQIMPQVHS